MVVKKNNFLPSSCSLKENSLNAKEEFGGDRVAILAYIFYSHLIDEIVEYINRLPFSSDVYITTRSSKILRRFKKTLSSRHNIIVCKHVDSGMDIGPFLRQLEQIVKSNKQYKYYLKIHSKMKDGWRKEMLEACLPKDDYKKIFSLLSKQHMVGSDKYLIPFSSVAGKNSDLINSQIKKTGLQITEEDLYDTVADFDPETASLDPVFYANYHQDLRMRCDALWQENIDTRNLMDTHWINKGKKEKCRVPNQDLITSKAKRKYKFFAGTIFWFDDVYLKYLLKNIDSFEDIFRKLDKEKKGFNNFNSTYTHHLEYWFGLLASHLNYPREIKGIVVPGSTRAMRESRGPFDFKIRSSALSFLPFIEFDWRRYLNLRPDLKKNWNGPVRAFTHYILFGKREIRHISYGEGTNSKNADVFWKKTWRKKVMKSKCLYIHIPKCAGTSIESILYGKPLVKFDWSKKIWIQHATIKELTSYYFSNKEMESLFTFAIVRNPFDRFVSTYNWLCAKKSIPKTKATFRDFVYARNEFDLLLNKKYSNEKVNFYHHMVPQLDFIEKNGKLAVDYVGRFENLEEEWRFISKKINCDVQLPCLNKEKHDHYSDYFDDETRATVERRYKKDLEYFGYAYEDNKVEKGLAKVSSGRCSK